MGILLGLLLKDHMLKPVEAQTFELPKSMKTLEGSCVVIPCKFTYAKPNPAIKWLHYNQGEIYNSKNSSLVPKSFLGRVSLVGDLAKGNCTIKIINVNSMDNGRYSPQIDSDPPAPEEESKENVVLYVNNIPEPIILSGPGKPIEGNTYVFTCHAKHTCPANPPTLTWNFKSLPAKTHHRELGDGVWETVSKLTYKAESEDNGKTLKCFAEYPNKQKTETRQMLNILYPPKMVSVQSTHKTGHVRKGEKPVLSCQGYGNPNITNYTWYKNNQTILFRHAIQVLHIDGMREDQTGQYYCVASNDIGETKSEPIILICVDCESLNSKAVVAAVVMVVLLIILAVVIVIWYRRKRASRPPNPPNPATEEASRRTNVYMNVMVPHNPKPVVESPYAALQTDNRCPDYEQLQPQNTQTRNKPPFHTSPSYSEYEEVIPFRSLQKKK